MIIFNAVTEELRAKDVGRIASQYYVLQTSVEIFNTMMQPRATEADVLKMISVSGEFDNIQSRDNEFPELSSLSENLPATFPVTNILHKQKQIYCFKHTLAALGLRILP